MTWYTGATKPDLEVTVSSPDGVDLTDPAIEIKILGSRDGITQDFEHEATDRQLVGATTVLTFPWEESDLAEEACIKLLVHIKFADGSIEIVAVFEPAEVEPAFAA